MESIIEIYQKELGEEEAKLRRVVEQLHPLEEQRKELEQNIKALRQLIQSRGKKKGGTPAPPTEALTGSLVGMTGKPAYMEIAKNRFDGQAFREGKIREYAIKEGLRVRGKPIQRVYSRSIIAELLREGFLKRPEYGLYQYNDEGQETSQEPKRLLDF